MIAGRFGGRKLAGAPSSGVRPTSDRVREALFARLGALEGARVLDLFAGTGALGIEALSRGAASAVFVDDAPGALAVLRRNLQSLKLLDATQPVRVVAADVRAALRRLGRAGERFDLVLADPPYASGEAEAALETLVAAEVLAPEAMVVVETDRRHPLEAVGGLVPRDERRYGDTLITRLSPPTLGEAEKGSRDMAAGQSDKSIAVFPASFDPVTNGHLDIIRRARAIFDELVVVVAHNVAKSGTFTVEERLALLKEVLRNHSGVEVDVMDGLLVEYARRRGAQVVIRGLRAMSDFEYEFEMALMNKHLHPELETIFMMASQEHLYVSSSRLKELVRFGGDVREFVPAVVAEKLKKKLGAGG